MKEKTMEKMKMHSPDLSRQNVEKLMELFPNCVTEAADGSGKLVNSIDFDLLKQELSDHIVEGPQERYRLDWPGKRKALLTANAPIAKTLRPARDESVDFDTTKNLFIEGDNLDALKLLQDTYLNKVKMIYIDPPYNTGNDFIYNDDFAEDTSSYLERSNQVDEEGNRLVANNDTNGRFHSDWLSMMYPRLKLARNLLRDDGVIFISIDDNEQANLKCLCDEIFGEKNFIGCAGRVTKKSNNKGDFWAPNFDYVLTYARNISLTTKFFGGVNYEAYNLIETTGPRKGEKYQLVRMYMSSLENQNPEQRFFITCPDGSRIIPPGETFPPERPRLGDGIWRWTKSKMEAESERIVIKKVKSSNLITEDGSLAKWNVFTKTYLSDVIANASAKPNGLIENQINQIGSHEIRALNIPFDFSKPTTLIQYLIEISKTVTNDIILDFFAGSGTTAHAVMQLNARDSGKRQCISVQLPELTDEKSAAYKGGYKNIAEISKERIRRAGKKIKKENPDADLDIGFRVLKVDTSNMEDVYYRPDEIDQADLLAKVDNIKLDRTAEDLLFQVLLDWGVDLTLPIAKENIHGKSVYFVDDNALVACFEQGIDEALVKELAQRHPMRVVFRDNGFASDAVKINITQIFKLMSPDTDVRTI